jgi:hypothetical protein
MGLFSREFFKSLPLALGLPVVIGAASIGPDDAVSNLSKWAHWVGFSNIPSWLTDRSADARIVVLSLVAAAFYVAILWGLPKLIAKMTRHPAAAPILSVKVKATDEQKRVFVPPELTPERLLHFFEVNTTIQAAELTKDRLGQWMRVTGTLRNVGGSFPVQVTFEKNFVEPLTQFDYADIYCYFRDPQQIDRLKIMRPGDRITVVGQISRIAALSLELDYCEFDPPASP